MALERLPEGFHLSRVAICTLGIVRIHALQHHAHGQGSFAQNLAQQLLAERQQLGLGHHVVHQAQAQGLVGLHHVSGQQQLNGFALANELGQPLRAAVAGYQAQVHLGLAEAGVVRGHAHVAGHGQLAAAAQRKAVHGRYHGLGAILNSAEGFLTILRSADRLRGREGG